MAQYASKHYIAPSPWQYWSDANEIVISTIAAGTVTVELKKSNGTSITTLTLTADNPVSYRFEGDPASLPRNTINSVASNRGLIVEATAPVSVNMRNIASDTPGTNNTNIKGNASLVSFGNEGLGLAFRLGYYRSSYTGIVNDAPIYSVMATENGTAISLNGTMTALLNAGQSRLFVAPMGSLLTSDKAVVVNVGTYGDTPQACSGNGEDATVDQIAPVNMLGRRYMLVRGNGTAGTGPNDPEQSTIVASEANTSVQLIHFDAAGNQIGTTTEILPNPGSFVTIHHGDTQNMYSSTFVNATKPVVVYSATAVNCETDISTVLPIGGCSGSKSIITRKFISYNNTDLPYFGYTILESATEPVFLNGVNLESLTAPRVPIGSTGFYMLRFTDVNIGNPAVINITSNARLTTSIIQQGEGFSMSGFFSAFSDSPEPPAKVSSTNTCSVTLSTTPGLEPYQWYLDDVLIPGAVEAEYTAIKTGNYTVVATRDCGLTAPSAPVFISVNPCTDLKVEKEVTSIVGNQAVFQITASNIGTGDDTNVRITDLLPNGYQFVNAVTTRGTYNNTTGIWTVGNLISGALETLTITAAIRAAGDFVNKAVITGTNTDVDLTNNTSEAIAQASALRFTKASQKETYYNVGDVIVYDLILTNTGQTVISNIVISDINADPGSISPALTAILNPGESTTIQASHTITSADAAAGSVTNQAEAAGENPDHNSVTVLSDNPKTTVLNDPTVTPVVLNADLVTVKTNNQTVYVPGTTTVYDISITNNGPSNAVNVSVNDIIPAGITTMSWTGNGKTGTGNLTDIIANIPVETTITYKVTVVIPEDFTGNLTNTVTVSSSVPDPNPVCAACTDTDTECTPPQVQTPSTLAECDDDTADGLKMVNLTSKNAEITNQNAQLHVKYYLNAADSANEIAIADPANFQMTIPYSQSVIAEISDASGCKTFVDLQIQISKKPEPAVLLEKTICQQDFYDLSVYEQEILNSETGTSVSGYFASRINAENNVNPISNFRNYTITNSNSVFIRVQNTGGCFAISELELNIIPAEGVNLRPKYTICYDANGNLISPAVIETGLSTSDFTFKWYKDGQLQSSRNASFTAAEPGTYTVEVTNSFGCPAKMASTEVVLSNGPENLKAKVVSEFFASNATIMATVTGTGNFVYSLDNGPEQESNYFYNVSAGTHIVQVKDVNGCAGTLTVEVLVVDYPKFFTPNGDGYNDLWNITSLKDQQRSIIYIFDRYAKLITSIKPSGEGWDGNYNGTALPSTDYWFKVIYYENETEKEFKAHFSLKR